MKYLYITRAGDRDLIIDRYNYYKIQSNKKLFERYNDNCKSGIVGVHRQAIELIALNRIFKEKFNKSPITIEDNSIIGLTESIIQDQSDGWIYNIKIG